MGVFWLISCVVGPLLGWVITAIFPLNVVSWRWLYGLRVILAAGMPLVTALPWTRYLRGKATWVELPILAVITFLPMLSIVNISRDLRDGPVMRQVQPGVQMELYLPHTERSLGPTWQHWEQGAANTELPEALTVACCLVSRTSLAPLG
jgi:MFS family permease